MICRYPLKTADIFCKVGWWVGGLVGWLLTERSYGGMERSYGTQKA